MRQIVAHARSAQALRHTLRHLLDPHFCMFGKFFDTSATEAFVRQVVGDLQKSIPPGRVEEKSNQADKRRGQLDALIRRRAETLASSVRLNVYQKAKLSPMLQEALTAAGYPETFSQSFAYDVMKLVAVASAEVR